MLVVYLQVEGSSRLISTVDRCHNLNRFCLKSGNILFKPADQSPTQPALGQLGFAL